MDNLERLMVDMKESLESEIGGLRREMHDGFAQVTARFETRFDIQAARLDRQAALIQVGSRWTARMNEWSEKVDQTLEAKDREIAELRTRIEKLEGKSDQRPQ
jgi:hypothetical protein